MHPRTLILIDGIGALLSAFLLGVVLIQLESIFGIPKQALLWLAFFPSVFALYDFVVYRNVKENLSFFLQFIASANLLYCSLSIGLAIYHQEKITVLGWSYISIEVLIVIILAIFELRTAAKWKTDR